MTQRTALVPVADGTEEIEAVTIIDTLRRAGTDVTVAAAGDQLTITCSRGVRLVADQRLQDLAIRDWDLVAVPGGMPGAEHLGQSAALTAILTRQHERRGLIGAICAAPAVVLLPLGLLADARATCHPAFLERIPVEQRDPARVVVSGHLVTSAGPGTALAFALELVARLHDRTTRDAVAGPMLVQD
jgi:4-methyl-5(b-hydroxyethyl)-thiazole monophosphate biosynthesis